MKQGQTATQQRSASQAAEKVQLSFLGNPVLRCAKHALARSCLDLSFLAALSLPDERRSDALLTGQFLLLVWWRHA
jgi:hypothetical protein